MAEKLKESYEKKIEGDDCFGIRITNAGRFFAYIQSDFEYFSSRYCKKIAAFSPLVWIKDIDTIKKIIETVFSNAEKCIRTVITFEKDYFRNYNKIYEKKYFHKWTSRSKEKNKKPHPYRIIDAHCLYLEHYQKFLRAERKRLEKERLEKERLEKERLERKRLKKERLKKEETKEAGSASVFSDSDIKILLTYIDGYIKKYKDLFFELKNETLDDYKNGYFCLLDKNLLRRFRAEV